MEIGSYMRLCGLLHKDTTNPPFVSGRQDEIALPEGGGIRSSKLSVGGFWAVLAVVVVFGNV
jgi:hypothetical protein